ncbi:FAD-dependent oxidoreductase [Novosphingobium sp.]|uniref:NAD(P)/FAD-dependent oxidoreductase n=1 Tax=Novosphingobium sp. TaxID=1874826 RepID=UPI001EB2F329|nr:FAD-dependent oxidoreductase [Novosphingobium sp.]MBK6802400.1 FAD-binding oxidoreductase [Novosphingobium sp.]MBK9009541.1 FAD-binding oxidoreductase [Novosphingobium sp.]
MSASYDFAIVGAGIAGASLAAGLASQGSVLLLEAEDRPGYHATGRSAAFWTESYGGPRVQPLTTASFDYLNRHGFLVPRGALTLARDGERAARDAFVAEFSALGVRVDALDRAAIERRLPGLADEWQHGAWEPDCQDIDVAGLHQHWLAEARRLGAVLRCRAALAGAQPAGEGWRLQLADGSEARAGLLINAAGAWADDIARIAGVAALGIQPYRRTVAQLRTDPQPPADLPLVLGLDGSFYFKPESGRLWLSPHDETPSQPCDCAPEELDVALAIDRFEAVVDWRIERVEHRWAGLRSFAPDRLPVYGFAPGNPRFFWFAGQGGFGIQTAPAAADLALRLILGDKPGPVDPEPYDPQRFA